MAFRNHAVFNWLIIVWKNFLVFLLQNSLWTFKTQNPYFDKVTFTSDRNEKQQNYDINLALHGKWLNSPGINSVDPTELIHHGSDEGSRIETLNIVAPMKAPK